SELKALLQDPSMPRAVNPAALHHYLTFGYVPAPLAILGGVRKLPPAHTLSYREGEATPSRYWRLSYGTKSRLSEEEAAEALRELIRAATWWSPSTATGATSPSAATTATWRSAWRPGSTSGSPGPRWEPGRSGFSPPGSTDHAPAAPSGSSPSPCGRRPRGTPRWCRC